MTRQRLTRDQIAARVLLGLAIGQAVVVVLDALLGGPGAFVLVGV
jgi:hypothetical protein